MRLPQRLLSTLAASMSAALILLEAAPPSGPSRPTAHPLARHGAAEAQARRSGFGNLQVLAEDISQEELIDTMKRMTKSLGTDCRFCHRTDVPDFATDVIKAKVVARQMMRMVLEMNRTSSGAKVTCLTCHRGQKRPSVRR